MIVINDVIFDDIKKIEILAKALYDKAYKEEYKIGSNLYKDYLLDCFEADIKLQELVSKNISDDYISFVILPINDTDDLMSFSFELASMSGSRIKRREQIKYEDFCRLCFENIVPFFERVSLFFS